MAEGTAVKEYQFPLKEPGVEIIRLPQGTFIRLERFKPREINSGFIQDENGISARRVEGKVWGLPAGISSEPFEIFNKKSGKVDANERFGFHEVVEKKK